MRMEIRVPPDNRILIQKETVDNQVLNPNLLGVSRE